MRVLLVSLRGPGTPPDGLSLIVGALVDRLRARHDVRLIAFASSAAQPADAATRLVPRPSTSIAARIVGGVAAVVSRTPTGVRRLAADLRPALDDELARFEPDVVHILSGRLALLARATGDRPIVLSAIDAWHLNVDARAAMARGPRRALLRLEAANARRFERRSYRAADRVVVVTEEDRRALRELAPGLAVDVIPNGVEVREARPAAPHGDRIVFHGVMSYPPNVLASVALAREVLPLVRAVRPSAEVALIGRDPAPEVQALGALPGVTVTGAVDDVFDWIGSGAVYACPITTGTGIKNKVLEAMAAGLACVTTPLAVQGLSVGNGREYVEVASPADMATEILRVLDDDALRDRLGAAAREHVRGAHSWDAVASAYEVLYEGAVDVRRSADAS